MMDADTHYPDNDNPRFSSEENPGNVELPIMLDADASKAETPKAKKKLGFWRVLLYLILIAAAILIAFIILRFVFFLILAAMGFAIIALIIMLLGRLRIIGFWL